MLKDAVRWGLLARNVAAFADPSFGRPPGDRDLDGRAAPHLPHSRRRRRVYAMWLTMITTGMRRGEVAELGCEHLDLDGTELLVCRTRVDYRVVNSEPKTEKGRRTVSLDHLRVPTRERRKIHLELLGQMLGRSRPGAWIIRPHNPTDRWHRRDPRDFDPLGSSHADLATWMVRLTHLSAILSMATIASNVVKRCSRRKNRDYGSQAACRLRGTGLRTYSARLHRSERRGGFGFGCNVGSLRDG